jgi:spore germination protein
MLVLLRLFFLSQVAEQDQAQEAERVKTIEVLYERARALAADLNQLGAKILREELSWTAVEMEAYAADEKLEDNTIVNGFRLLEKNMAEYPEINLASDFAQFVPDKVIESEREISLPEAEKKAVEAWFLKGNNKEAKVIYEGVGDVPTFGVEITSPEDNDLVYVDVSKIDGTMIWGMQVKEITQSKLTLKEGEEIALRFLKVRDFPPFEVVKAQKEDHTGVYTLVPRQNKVLLYPDQVKIQVALDEGTVIGFEGTPYYLFHKKRDFPEVQLQPQAIKELLNPRLKVELIQLALIIDASGKEVLTWEVRGSFAEEKFAVFF